MKYKQKFHAKRIYIATPVFLVILFTVLNIYFDKFIRKPSPVHVPVRIWPTGIPLPSPQTDWKQYAKSIAEPTIGAQDLTEKYWSPSKNYYLLRVIPQGNVNGSFIVVYSQDGKYVFGFNPRTVANFGSSGVAKRFHDYWINDHSIAFVWRDENYTGQNNTFRYDLDNKQFDIISNDIVDYDDVGGYLKVKRHENTSSMDVYYINRNLQSLYVGSLEGTINGLSPSGKYIVYFSKNHNYNKPDGSILGYNRVFITKIVNDGISKGVEVGQVKYFVGGIEGITDYPFAQWGIDEKSVAVNWHLTESKAFTNPFVQ